MRVKITGQFGYQSSPETEDMIDVPEDDLRQLGITKQFDVENNCVIDYVIPVEIQEKMRVEEYRRKREPLLEAFDKWEKAVIRGRETDDTQVMAWYNDLKDLKPSALDNIPDRVQYYLKTE